MTIADTARELDQAASVLERQLAADTRRPRTLTITKLERDAEGIWRARVTGADGVTIDVNRRWGSWEAEVRRTPGARTFTRRPLLAPVAAALQAKVRPLEKKEHA